MDKWEKISTIVSSWIVVLVLVGGFWVTRLEVKDNTDARRTQTTLGVINKITKDIIDERYRDYVYTSTLNRKYNTPKDRQNLIGWEKYYSVNICLQRKYYDKYDQYNFGYSFILSLIRAGKDKGDLIDLRFIKSEFCPSVSGFIEENAPAITRLAYHNNKVKKESGTKNKENQEIYSPALSFYNWCRNPSSKKNKNSDQNTFKALKLFTLMRSQGSLHELLFNESECEMMITELRSKRF